MMLPFSDKARVEQNKITDYLLAFDHPEGASKARFFTRFGFNAAEWQLLAEALVAQALAHEITSISESAYGTKYQIDGPIFCPDRRSPLIRTVWIVDAGSDFPRLVTAHPL